MAVTDEAARAAAYLTLAEVCFILGLRNTRLAPELGRPDLFLEASRAARSAHRYGLATLLDSISRIHRAAAENRLFALVSLAENLPKLQDEVEPWLRVEIDARAGAWMQELEAALFNGHNASVLINLLPPFYQALRVQDAGARTQRLQQRAIQLLIKEKQFAEALAALRALPERQPKLEAVCHEGLADFRSAAECHMAAGNLKEAVNCYRSIPDLDASLKLLSEIGDHPAAESLQWMARVRQLMAERPEKFNRTMVAAEKKLLQEMLERGLGVTRRKPAERKTTKPAARKVATKTPAPRGRPRKKLADDADIF
jgi:tetratricopeptide (TPR) repeat protein